MFGSLENRASGSFFYKLPGGCGDTCLQVPSTSGLTVPPCTENHFCHRLRQAGGLVSDRQRTPAWVRDRSPVMRSYFCHEPQSR